MTEPKGPPPGVMDREMVAEMLGIKSESVKTYLNRGDGPEPDGYVGGSPWWWVDTIEQWIANRPGKWGHHGPNRRARGSVTT